MSGHDMHRDLNRSLWDRLADVHSRSEGNGFYDVAGFLAGETALTEIVRAEMTAAVGSVEGLKLLHLQCHFGLDTLSWARLGASVTGVDFSPVAVERARALAERAGLAATFVEADVQQLPSSLDERFDVVFASYGALCWTADLSAWFDGAFRALRASGSLVVVEVHPLMLMIDSVDPIVFAEPYLGGTANVDQWEGSYASGAVSISQPSVGYSHGIGEVVSAAAQAGFVVDDLTEHLREQKENRPGILTPDPDGRLRLHVAGQDLPVTYSLRATKPTPASAGSAPDDRGRRR